MAYTPALKRAIYKWRKKNREKINAYQKEWREKNNWSEYYSDWQKNNKDKIKEYAKKAYLKSKLKKLWQKRTEK